MKDHNIFVYKNISLYSHERVEMAASEWERERERDKGFGLLSLIPRWVRIFIFTPRCDRSIFSAPLNTSLTEMIKTTSQHKATGTQGLCPNRLLLWLTANLNLHESVFWLWISCHYIIFSMTTYFFSGSQITWFIPTVSLFIVRYRCDILFRNPQLTCCQRSICNTLFHATSSKA